MHLTMTRDAPEHTLTLTCDGQTVTMTVPESPCPTSKHHVHDQEAAEDHVDDIHVQAHDELDDHHSGWPGGGGPSGGVVIGPGVWLRSERVPAPAVHAASTGTLPFTGSDIRAFAVLGNLLVLIGFAML